MTAKHKPHRPASLILRVTALVGVAISVCLVVLGWVVLRSIEIHFVEQDTDELRVVAAAVDRTLKQRVTDPDELRVALSSAISGHHGVYFRVNTSDGEELYASPGADLASIAGNLPLSDSIERGNLTGWRDGDTRYRGAAIRSAVTTPAETLLFIVTVAAATNFHTDFLARFQTTLWSIITAAAVITVLAAWLAVHQGHTPLRRISENIRAIRSDQLSLRLDIRTVPTELLELVSSFNGMLDRIEDVFQRLSNFSADIAHELRTPITNLSTQTQVALSKARSVDEYREILYSNLEEYERLAKMVNDMLWLAKTDNGLLAPALSSFDVAGDIEDLFDYFSAWAEERGVLLALAGEHPVIRADRSMLRRALSNLLSNGIRYTPKGETLTVTLQSSDAAVIIGVENPGTIAADQLSKIFDRFYRADPSRKYQGDGAGLGLAIAKSIVNAHGGTLSVTSEDNLTRFEIRIPYANR